MDILKQIKPSKQEEEKVIKISNHIISKIKIKNTRSILGGSGAKGTWLKGSHDMDIFVKFSISKYKDKDISKILEKELKRKFKIIKIHGSRDYFQIKQKDFTIEIIPILNIKKSSQAKNITDVSPLHSKWVKSKTNPKLTDEIRLTKAFFKANKLYGAESHIRGFSGYVLEILTIHYGSFNKLIKAIQKWKSRTIIDTEKYNTAFRLNKSKISPLIIIDPVQSDRNAAAALSQEKFNQIIKLSKKKISFKPKKINTEKYNLILEIKPISGKKDVVGAKLLKALNYLIKNLSDFKVISHDWDYDKKTFFYIKTKLNKLDKYKKHYGPKIKDKENIKKFKAKHKKIYKEKNKVYAKILIKHRTLKGYTKNLLKEKYFKDKIKKLVISSS